MISYVDSHCHLNMLDDVEAALTYANEQGVKHFLCVAVTLDDHKALTQIASQHSSVFISVGLHPNEMPQHVITVADLLPLAKHPRVIAIGETGLDYFRVEGDKKWQQDRFIEHIECARQLSKPLIIHTRQAKEDTIKILAEQDAKSVGGVMHCFTEDWETARKALDLGFYISFSGIVTFKNAIELQQVAKLVPLDRMLIETDSPYLAPVPHRGKTNQPGYVCHVAEFISTLRGEPIERIAEQTTENFFTLFSPPS